MVEEEEVEELEIHTNQRTRNHKVVVMKSHTLLKEWDQISLVLPLFYKSKTLEVILWTYREKFLRWKSKIKNSNPNKIQ